MCSLLYTGNISYFKSINEFTTTPSGVCVRISADRKASAMGVTRHRRKLKWVYKSQAMHAVDVLNTCSFCF